MKLLCLFQTAGGSLSGQTIGSATKMRLIVARIATILVAVCIGSLFAQEPDKPVTSVPRLVRVNGTFHPANGLPVGTVEGATLAIYREEQGGAPLWQETQNVALDANGQYTAMLGITQKDGVPLDLFSSTEPRWLGVQFNRSGEVEQPRVQLVSVPYALKASDAESLGGKPASAYLLDPNALAMMGTTANATTTPASLPDPTLRRPRPTPFSGSMNYIPYFTDNIGSLGNSLLYQSSGKVGIGTTTPLNPFHVHVGTNQNLGVRSAFGMTSVGAFTDPGNLYVPLNFDASSFYFSTGNVGIGTASPQDTLHVQGGFRIGNGLFDSNGFSFTQDSTGNLQIQYKYPTQVFANVMALTYSGNVGIGNTTPGSKLDVAGQINSAGGYCINGTNCITAWPSGGNGSGTVTSVTAGRGRSGAERSPYRHAIAERQR